MWIGLMRLWLWLWLWFDPSPLLTMLLPDVVIGFDCVVLLWLTRLRKSTSSFFAQLLGRDLQSAFVRDERVPCARPLPVEPLRLPTHHASQALFVIA